MPTEIRTTRPTVVLKFGGSVLAREADIADAVHECYRWVRDGWSVVAVVSAIGDSTERLIASTARYGHSPSPHAAAALIATGETVSAAHLWLGCDRAGIDAVAVDPREIGLAVAGPVLDALPTCVDSGRLRSFCEQHDVVVVPGFFGIGPAGRLALLGRGGSDLTAVLLAHALGARCRLLKDVPGLFERDPSRPGPFARRYARITFDDARPLAGEILQRKALAYAAEHGVRFEVATPHQPDATQVGADATSFAAATHEAPLRVALLGLGVVGRGVLEHLRSAPGSFEVTGIAVLNPKRHADTISPRMLQRDAVALAASPTSEVVIETMGGLESAHAAIVAALERGAAVVTANKTLLAAHGASLLDLASAHGTTLAFSAAVGGAAPVLELASRLHDRGVATFEAVLNGTTNCILGACAAGSSFADALAEAQALGYAESNASADLSGADAAEKLQLVCRIAFGREPDDLSVSGLDSRASVSPFDRLVARAHWRSGRLVASVAVERLFEGHALLAAEGVWNLAMFRTLDGASHLARGKGAGRFPTAEAVFADLLELRRRRAGASAATNELVGGAA